MFHILITLRRKLISLPPTSAPVTIQKRERSKIRKRVEKREKGKWREMTKKTRNRVCRSANGLVYMCLRGNGKGNRCGCFANETIVSCKRAREAGKG